MNSDRYHVEVYVRESGNVYAWRRVHPVGGDPYVFTKAEAENYIRSQAGAYGSDPKNWRAVACEPLA